MSRIVVKVGGAVASGRRRRCSSWRASNEVSSSTARARRSAPRWSAPGSRSSSSAAAASRRRGIEIVRASLAAVNAGLWAELGPRAVPFFGADVGLRAEPIPELGLVGDPVVGDLPLLDA